MNINTTFKNFASLATAIALTMGLAVVSPMATASAADASEEHAYTLNTELAMADFGSNCPACQWSAFNIPEGETAVRVEATITSDSTIGTWNGAFGTDVDTDQWYQTDDFNIYYDDTTATAVWYVDSETAERIDYVDGELKIGFWWMSNEDITLESVTVYTNVRTAQPRVHAAETVYGDVDENGRINIMDAILLNRYLMIGAPLSEQGMLNADVDNSGSCDATDSLTILKYITKIVTSLPIA
ncbi:MAG: dockerin type I repeat-containing protein [Oscillospiraceae bacterium]|nr:dockerin type I repeat-containing protein [Oscillospiraceae bacterium]